MKIFLQALHFVVANYLVNFLYEDYGKKPIIFLKSPKKRKKIVTTSSEQTPKVQQLANTKKKCILLRYLHKNDKIRS